MEPVLVVRDRRADDDRRDRRKERLGPDRMEPDFEWRERDRHGPKYGGEQASRRAGGVDGGELRERTVWAHCNAPAVLGSRVRCMGWGSPAAPGREHPG